MEDSNEYENMLVTILETSKITRANTNPLSDDDSIRKQEEALDCLKVEEDIIPDYFQFESKFENTLAKYLDPNFIDGIYQSLSKLGYINYKIDQMPSVGIVHNIETMVESVYNYEKTKSHQIAEEICYVGKIASHWRTIGGDGNCFYRSAIFGYLETIVFERDIIRLKTMISEIDQKFDENYINTKYLNWMVKDPITRLNKKTVITILYIIYDILDMSNGRIEDIRKAYSILIKAMNNSTSFDIVIILPNLRQ
jgi:hypothetical protein